MVLHAGALDETLAAAAGSDPALAAELRAAFAESLANHVNLLQRARCDANWHVAALRIRGLAASFQVQPLIDLADAALAAAPGEPTVVRALSGFAADLAGTGPA
ncbi:Hpt domain-containing protein [Novosphingobium piscinae]|uniref:Hpt domain-containing protein n=1 Tax=Novosphingobium piscinae TaxID=1507448 RepID=A0A7X1FZ70_9SPHN|nr:Hpt domain-containing protein [Novosphingobium piscinae]MBC2669631.1 Hpt domain-containing protein [Novosphingobium piscinae]